MCSTKEDVLITPRAFICGNDGTRVEGGRGEGGGVIRNTTVQWEPKVESS